MVTVGIVAVSSSEHHCYNTVIVLNTKKLRAELPLSVTLVMYS